jgi:hypothetical protein
MRTLVLLVVAVVALVGLALHTFGSAVVPEAVPSKAPNRSMTGSRFFMLLPDGTVEISDAWARRVYRWDGRQWLQVDVNQAATPRAELQ